MSNTKKYRNTTGKIVIILSIAVLLMVIIVTCYFGNYYHYDNRAHTAISSKGEFAEDTVTLEKDGTFWLLDGPGTEAALIFYPGAKVEAEAYAPLMRTVAAGGMDCFLCDMPLNFALLDIDKANDILNIYDYDHWYIAGHSLGGVAAAKLCEEEGGRFDGLVLLASYSSAGIDQPDTLCIYGTEDKVLNMDSYNEAISEKRYPEGSREVIITGGNHAQFGDYGVQKGDGKASVSAEIQQKQTADAIIEMMHGDLNEKD